MTVIEATTDKDFRKIVEFLKKQSDTSFGMVCFRLSKAEKTLAWFKEKLKAAGYRVFCYVDVSGNVRGVVWFRVVRNPGVDPYLSNLGGVRDYAATEGEVVVSGKHTEVFRYALAKVVSEDNRIARGEFQFPEALAQSYQQTFGESMKIKFKQPHAIYPELGTISYVTVDLTKFLALS